VLATYQMVHAAHAVGERMGAAKATFERTAKVNLGRGFEATANAKMMAKVRKGLWPRDARPAKKTAATRVKQTPGFA
jgi:hypothetical protein